MKLKHIYYIGGFLGVYLLTPHLVYFCKVADGHRLDLSELGQYGDFTGGISNPLLAVLNIIALLYVTYVVGNLEEKRARKEQCLEDARNKANIDTQKLIALNAFRHDALNQLKDYLDKFEEFPDTFLDMTRNYNRLQDYIENFSFHYSYLFNTNDFNKVIENLEEAIGHVTISVGGYIEEIKEPLDLLGSEFDTSNFDDNYKLYLNLKQELIPIMQHIILDKPYVRPIFESDISNI